MSLNTLENIEAKLRSPQIKKKTLLASAVEKIDAAKLKKDLSNEINKKSNDLHRRIERFHTILSNKFFEGYVNLGTDSEKIDWESMPKAVADCFKPEFLFQPSEITKFRITTKDERQSNGEMGISMQLDRNGQWWSYVHVGAIVRDDYKSGTLYASCSASHGQVTEAREGMSALESSMWGDTQEYKDQHLPHLIHGKNALDLTESVLQFAATQAEKQVTEAEQV
jgi:hypothetical protein